MIRKTFQYMMAERRRKKCEKRRFKIALAFNSYHTHHDRYWVPKGSGGRWMCPKCNSIHACIDFSVFTGRIFPECCDTKKGPRIFKENAVPGHL